MNLEEQLLKTSLAPQWLKVGIKPHHGIDIPLSALHTEKSCGIGEFYDLIPLIDWCVLVGMDVIQLLPLNDTGDDTSPFFALSALALNPLFLSLHQLEGIDPNQLKELQALNRLSRVPYHQVQAHKTLILRTYFEEKGSAIVKTKEFEKWLKENTWSEGYGLFKVLKDVMQKNHWTTWPQELQQPTEKEFDALLEKYWVEVCFYIFQQYLCFQQLTDVKAYANKMGVFLKGDIPILISPDSADVWRNPQWFDLTHMAGAPPDAFNEEGQMWGLPIFNWEVIKQENYRWWKERLRYASQFYDLYRIDHALGFFRIYAIPPGKSGKEGIYIPADKADWLPHGKEILLVLCDFTSMLPIAEDLGDVPESVRATLAELGICGTKVIRWEKRWSDGKQFIDPLHYNPISMTTVSTHDSETLFQWWRDEPKEAKAYAHYKGWDFKPELTQGQRREILWDSHHSSSLFHINLLGEYLALFPELVWENPDEERINVPGTLFPSNWTYRIRPTVEEILTHKKLAEEVKNLL